MRPSASLCQTSRYRLLTLLLLVLLLGCIGTHMVNGFPGNFSNYKHVKGGTSFKKDYYLVSKCSEQYVQMKVGRKPLNARGQGRTKFAVLVFESIGHGQIRIKGNYSNKYICFSRKGRLIARSNGDTVRCQWNEVPASEDIKLQSVANEQWYMGFNRRGRKMKGHKHAKLRHLKRKKCFYFSKLPHERHLLQPHKNPYSPFKSDAFKNLDSNPPGPIAQKAKQRRHRKLRHNRKRKNNR